MQQGLISGSRPDLTPAQLIAGIPIIGELLHTFGAYDLSQAQQDSLGKTVTFCFGLLGADAAVRIGRNLKDARVESTAIAQGGEAPIGPIYPSQDYNEPYAEVPEDSAVDLGQEEPLTPEEISELDYQDADLDEEPDLGEDPDLDDEDLGPIGDADMPEEGKD